MIGNGNASLARVVHILVYTSHISILFVDCFDLLRGIVTSARRIVINEFSNQRTELFTFTFGGCVEPVSDKSHFVLTTNLQVEICGWFAINILFVRNFV